MKNEIVVVSAFFSINRENWKGFSRSNNKYFEYFKCWAKLKNKIIVYVESDELKNQILDFRESIGLREQTHVVVIDNILQVDEKLYQSILSTSLSSVVTKYRLLPHNPECWNAAYNYIMLMKMWCCSDAVKRGLADNTNLVAWVDFGYNHGGEHLDINSNFNFKWEYDFPEKINLFLIQKLDDRPIFDIVLSMDTYVMGMVMVGFGDLWGRFWEMMRENMMKLNSCGLMDDDQNIVLMCVRECPEMFNLYNSSWQIQLKQFGNDEIKYTKHKKTILDPVKTVLVRLRYKYKCLRYGLNLFYYLSKRKLH